MSNIEFFNKFFNKIKSFLKRKYHELIIFNFYDKEKVFEKIYINNYWGSLESLSGPGSTLKITTNLRKKIIWIIKKYKIKRIFDAPCGDFKWMKKIIDTSKLNYIGGDIVHKLIKDNNQKYKAKKNKFIKINLTKTKFPKADLWICRALFFHLSFKDINKVLKKLENSEIRYCLITNNITFKKHTNLDIKSGSYRDLNLFKPPFNFPKNYILKFSDTYHFKSKKLDQEMIFWKKKDLMSKLNIYNKKK